jgi:adenylate cyclase class IV
MELEVVLQSEDDPLQGQAIAQSIMDALDLRQSDLIEGAYIDLLEQ